MRKDDLNVHVFQNRIWRAFHRKEFKWKKKKKKKKKKNKKNKQKNGGTGLVSEKPEPFYAELNERVEAASSSYSATGEFLQIFFTDIFFNSVLDGSGFLLLLWKGAQNNAHCNCIVPP